MVGLWWNHASQNHCHSLFCDGHWFLEGSQASHHQNHTPHAQTTNPRHKPQATSHTQHTTHHKPSQVKPNRTEPSRRAEPSRAKPSQATPSQTELNQATPHHAKSRHAKQARPNQARQVVQSHFQFKENVVDASASPVAALLIQWENGCVMDARTVGEVAGTNWCGTVLSRTLTGSHGHSSFSFAFPSDAVPLLLRVSLHLTAATRGTAQHLCRCCGCGCGNCHCCHICCSSY